MRIGRRVAVDFGSVRIGIASCDRDGILASPLPAVTFRNLADAVSNVSRLAEELGAIEIYVGLPISLKGAETKSTSLAKEFAIELAKTCLLPIRFIDERMTTLVASSKLRQAGISGKQARQLVDSQSAVEILEAALAFEKNTGSIPGVLVGGQLGSES